MLPSIGFPEMLVVALLAIIFVGPKDLPQLMRTIGQWVARIRAMGNEFKSAFDDMGVDDEVASIRREIEEMKSLGSLDPDLDSEMRAIDQDLRQGTNLSSPHKPDPKLDAQKPKPVTKAKPKPKTKAKVKAPSKSKTPSKTKSPSKPKPKPKPKVTKPDGPSDD